MNREIEFRGQDFFTGKWVFGSLHKNEVGDLFILTDKGDFRAKPETVGQFTTHRDCKDNKIYEGDIIHIAGRGFKEYDFGVVTWHKNGYFFVDDSFGKYEKSNVNPIGDFFDRTKHDFNGIVITVNGNIHDNKREV